MPVIAAAGSNTGTQAATLVIRALATGAEETPVGERSLERI